MSLPESECRTITAILNGLNAGGPALWEELVPLVYAELKKIARAYMHREPGDHVLQPTALVHETYLRLIEQKAIEWQNRVHFYCVASLLMRRILLDNARRRRIEERARTFIAPIAPGQKGKAAIDVEDVDAAIAKLEQKDARLSRTVELRYFGGMSMDQVAQVMGVSSKTVQRDWAVARAWLHGELNGQGR